MNETDIVDLFEAIVSGDNRREFSEDDVRFWLGVARHAGWNRDSALRAVTAHYAEKRTWIMPADITAFLRDPAESGQRIVEY